MHGIYVCKSLISLYVHHHTMDKGVLAFSGGLDTSVVVKYLQEEHNLDVITVTVDVGQGDDYSDIKTKSEKLGAISHYNIDARKEFVLDYVHPAIKANALYQDKYCLATALARPLIAQKVIEVAKKEGAKILAHGCSGKGNDQVRFDLAFMSGSDLPIVAPIRDKNLDREAEIQYAQKQGVEVSDVARRFSIDQNLWGRAIEGGVLEDPFAEPPDDAFIWTRVRDLPAEPTYTTISFQEGVPVAINDQQMDPLELITQMNQIAGQAGVGIIDHIEDRTVGLKSREIYETPGATCLIEAHSDLEKMVHTIHQNRLKRVLDDEWARLAYLGLWDEPLRRDIDAFIQRSQKVVTGKVRLKMQGGFARVVGRKSKYSLYDAKSATYGADSTFDQRLATGFVKLWGAQSAEANKLQGYMTKQ